MSLNSFEMIAAFERRFFSHAKELIASTGSQSTIAIAYSGGLDSSVLLHLMSKFAQQNTISLLAIHIHHGLSPHAEMWLAHCRDKCSELGVAFESQRVHIEPAGQGIEAAARRGRYMAIGQICARWNAHVVLTAHHVNDQAETVLMQLLRGSGVRGLSGMDARNSAATLLGNPDLMIARPLLGEGRETLEAYARFHQITHIEDESNFSAEFVRNALRLNVMPQLEHVSPGFAARLVRTASHMREAQVLLDELAGEDLQRAEQLDGSLSLAVLVKFNLSRVKNLFRFWLIKHDVQLPSSSKLEEMWNQLMDAREDARIQVYHDGVMLSRYQDRVFIVHNRSAVLKSPAAQGSQIVVWNGEDSLQIPGFSGRLIFHESDVGISRGSLLGQALECKQRPQGVRLRLAKNRPSRDIKSHFQSAGVPFWRRDQVPFIYVANQLLFVGELGMDAAFIDEAAGPKIHLEWLSD